jgi:hypothetical protein
MTNKYEKQPLELRSYRTYDWLDRSTHELENALIVMSFAAITLEWLSFLGHHQLKFHRADI